MHAKKKLWIKIGIIALVAVIGIGIGYYLRYVRFQSPIVFLPDAQNIVNNNDERTVRYGTPAVSFDRLREVSGGTAANASSYEDALKLYRGQVVQFNANCRAYPVIMTVPAKNVVMLDNQSSWERTIRIGQWTYSIAPYDYVLASFNMTGDYAVNCDSAEKVGIVSVQ